MASASIHGESIVSCDLPVLSYLTKVCISHLFNFVGVQNARGVCGVVGEIDAPSSPVSFFPIVLVYVRCLFNAK
jgi:hypothetical protein